MDKTIIVQDPVMGGFAVATEEEKTKKMFEDSIKRARECGLPEDAILTSIEDIDKFFTE